MFSVLKNAVAARLKEMQQGLIFVASKGGMWELYLESFPEGTNPVFRERTEHDCSCCRQFIRDAGTLVSIDSETFELESIWDVQVGGHYQVVADALAREVRSRAVENIFLHSARSLGTDFNHERLGDGTVKQWDHFCSPLDPRFVRTRDRGTELGEARARFDVFSRGMQELNQEDVYTVLELIRQNSLYRGQEHESLLTAFSALRRRYEGVREDLRRNFCWTVAASSRGVAMFRNSVIGTLVTDLSSGMELGEAVGRFESKVAPTNYKRSSALVTPTMIKKAQEKAQELGIVPSLARRHACMEDLTINNVVFASRAARQTLDPFDELSRSTPVQVKKFDRIDEIGFSEFIASVVPTADKIEVMTERRHNGNFMSLLAPEDPGAKRILKWDNNFSWAYADDVTDSIRENVRNKGGNVEGYMRFSIQWNDDPVNPNPNDYDAHCIEPGGRHIYYPTKGVTQPSSGCLDVDIIKPEGVAVENIVWTNPGRMPDGTYVLRVHCYAHRGGRDGFSAQIELAGKVYEYEYRTDIPNNHTVEVASVRYTRGRGLEITNSLDQRVSSQTIWGTTTNVFTPVSAIMYSPNHWDGQAVGNKHVFFILEGCRNEEPVRGFFNEFLRPELVKHRKVFEVLGSRMKAQPAQDQLSGLGFSTTRRNHVTVRVTGQTMRTLKVLF